MNTAFPYDPTGTNPECLITTGETHPISTYYNKWRCIIPLYAPFYRKDLIVKHVESGRELREGLDYYLGHKFVSATEENQQMIFGSIFLIDLELKGTIVFEQYRTLGGIYNISRNQVLEYLAGDFDDPRNCTWEEVAKHIIEIPALHRPTNLEDAIETDLVTGALHDLQVAIEAGHTNLDKAYTEFDNKLTALEGQVQTWEIPSHKFKKHPHQETFAQVNALGLTDDAKNALHAYGRTLAELTVVLNRMGATQEDLDKLAAKSGFLMQGDLQIDNGVAKFKNHDGFTTVDLVNGDINVISTKAIEIKGDLNRNKADISSTLESGHNMLGVASSGSQQKNKTLIYNGAYVITAGNIKDYIPVIPESIYALRHEDTASITLRGRGDEQSPLYGSCKFFEATPSTPGTIRVTDSIYINIGSIAASSIITAQAYKDLQTFALKTTTVNGKPLSGPITITKAELGLGNVENFSDAKMPFSDAFIEAMNNKSPLNHKHYMSEIVGHPVATETVKGLFYMSDDGKLETKDKVARSTLMLPIMDVYNETDVLIENAMPAEAINVTHFGDNSYLPIPAAGAYPATGNDGVCSGMQIVEADGTFVFLRNGFGPNDRNVYYGTATVKANGELVDVRPTSTKYHPTYLPAGSYVRRVITQAGDYGLVEVVTSQDDSKPKYHLIRLNATLDGSKHTGREVILPPNFLSMRTSRLVVTLDKMYAMVFDNDGGIRVYGAQLNSEAIIVGNSFIREYFAVTDAYGDTHPPLSSGVVKIFNKFYSTDINDKPIYLNRDPSYYFQHTNIYSTLTAVKGNTIRLRYNLRCLYNNKYVMTEMFNKMVVDFHIDTMTVTTTVSGYPIIFEDGKFIDNDNCEKVFNYCGSLDENSRFVRSNDIDSALIANNNSLGVVFLSNEDLFEALDSKVYEIDGVIKTTGAYASEVKYNPINIGLLPGKHVIGRMSNVTHDYVISTYDENVLTNGIAGLGPTLDRKAISADEARKAYHMITMPTTNHDMSIVGAILTDNLRTTPFDYSNGRYNGSIGIGNLQFDTLKESFKTVANRNLDPEYPVLDGEDRLSIYVFKDAALPCLAVYVYRQAQSDGSTRGGVLVHWLDDVNRTPSTPTVIDIGSPTIGGEIYKNAAFYNLTAGMSDTPATNYDGAYATTCILNQSTRVMSAEFNLNFSWSVPGWYYFPVFSIDYNVDTKAVTNILAENQTFTLNVGRVHLPKYGKSTLKNKWKDSAAVATTASGNDVIVLSPDVPSNWMLYITSPVDFYTFKNMHTLAPANFDLRALFPGAYTNSHFYMYVVINKMGLPEYRIMKEKLNDDDHRTYVGDFLTNSDRIYSVNIKSVTRLGISREMDEHFRDTNAHNFHNMSPGLIGLPDMVNKPLEGIGWEDYAVPYIFPTSKVGTTYYSHALMRGAMAISTTSNATTQNISNFITKKRITPTTNLLDFYINADDEYRIYIDGVYKDTGRLANGVANKKVAVTPNREIEVAIWVGNDNGGGTDLPNGHSACFTIYDGTGSASNNKYWISDMSWLCKWRMGFDHTAANNLVRSELSSKSYPWMYYTKPTTTTNIGTADWGGHVSGDLLSLPTVDQLPGGDCMTFCSIITPETDTLTFYAFCDDSAIVHVNGEMILNQSCFDPSIGENGKWLERSVVKHVTPGIPIQVNVSVYNSGNHDSYNGTNNPCYAAMSIYDGDKVYSTDATWVGRFVGPRDDNLLNAAVREGFGELTGYGSNRQLVKTKSMYNKSVISGTAYSGATLPTPKGCSHAETVYVFTPVTRGAGRVISAAATVDVTMGLDSWATSVDSNGVLTATYNRESERNDPTKSVPVVVSFIAFANK